MKILHFIADQFNEYNSSNFRVTVPATALIKSGLADVEIMSIREWLRQTPDAVRACSEANVIVLQRVLVETSFDIIRQWRNAGKAVIVDFDDAYDLIRPDNAAYKFWGKGLVDITLEDGNKYERPMNSHPIDQFRRGLGLLSGYTTPSRILCDDWKQYSRPYYLPNYLDYKIRYEKTHKVNNSHIVIGWGGSLSHVPGFTDSGILGALERVFAERDGIKFLLVGDKRILDYLPIPKHKLLYQQYVKYDDWPQVLQQYDIGLAPLYGKYDCRRSHLKVMEYISLGIPFVATDSEVYQDFYTSSSGKFVYQGHKHKCDEMNEDGWYYSLIDIIDNIGYYTEGAMREQIDFRNLYDVDLNVKNIKRVYQRIIDNNG